MTQTFPNSNITLTETKVDLPGFLCPFFDFLKGVSLVQVSLV